MAAAKAPASAASIFPSETWRAASALEAAGIAFGVREVRGQPAAALGLGLRMATDRPDGAQPHPRPGQQREGDGKLQLGLDQQVAACGEIVEGRRDDAFHRALDRDDGPVGRPGPHRRQRRLDRGARQRLGMLSGVQRAERRLGEGAFRSQVGVTLGHNSLMLAPPRYPDVLACIGTVAIARYKAL